VLVVNLVVFTGVGVSMTDVFRRVMLRLERATVPPLWWLAIVGVIGSRAVLLLRVVSIRINKSGLLC